MEDTRHVYGARCTWHGSITQIGKRGDLPCCPHCGNMLFEVDTEAKWQEGVDKFNAGHPGYTDFCQWLNENGRCWPIHAMSVAFAQWRELTGKNVEGWQP